MLILRPPGTRTLDLPGGVRLTVRPAGQIHFDIAVAQATRGLNRAADGGEALARYGVGFDLLERLPEVSGRIATAAVAIELGLAHITAWEGVGAPTGEKDADGEDVVAVAPIDAATVAVFMNAQAEPGLSYGDVFLARMRETYRLEASSKKGSAASPGGSGVAAESTAGSAD